VALASGVVGLAIGIIFQANVGPGSKYEFFLLLISYWIAPYLAVVLLDYWLRQGAYDERVFYDPHYRPWRGLVAMAAGLVVSFPFWNNPLFKGPVPTALPWVGDLTFVVGFIVAAAVYYALYPRSAAQALRAG
jgi:purine-cytosine permease-like protein